MPKVHNNPVPLKKLTRTPVRDIIQKRKNITTICEKIMLEYKPFFEYLFHETGPQKYAKKRRKINLEGR